MISEIKQLLKKKSITTYLNATIVRKKKPLFDQ